MAQFMDIHSGMKGLSAKDVAEAHRKDLSLEKEKGVHFIRYWADPSAGKIFCLSEGPSKEAVLEIHRKAGHPTNEIYEVALSGE